MRPVARMAIQRLSEDACKMIEREMRGRVSEAPERVEQGKAAFIAASAGAAPASHPVIFATLLTILAGFLDAAAYVELDHLFVSFMSGNSTHLGLVLADGSMSEVWQVLVIVLAFVAGACGGTWIVDSTERLRPNLVLGGELVLLLLAVGLALLSRIHLALVLVTVAMGMQNVLHRQVSGADLGKSFITGALFGLGQSVARLLRGGRALGPAISNLGSWLSFVGGAGAGALGHNLFGLVPCLVAASAAVAGMIAALAFGRT